MTGKGGFKKTWLSTQTFPPTRKYEELWTSSCTINVKRVSSFTNLEPAERRPLHIQSRLYPKNIINHKLYIYIYIYERSYISNYKMMLQQMLHHCHRHGCSIGPTLIQQSNPGSIQNLHRNCQVQHHWHLEIRCQWPTNNEAARDCW